MTTPSNQALMQRSTDTELMPPPAKRIKRPPKVLDEDSYTNALSEIIARDFFPGLLETQTQQEYLDALESHNSEWIASAERKLTQVMTPGSRRGARGTSLQHPVLTSDTPRGYGGDTPMTTMSDFSTTSAQPSKPTVNLNMSLDSFQSKYTSEDNESFNKLLDKQNQKRAEKYSWMWQGNKIPTSRQIKQREREKNLLEAKALQEKEDGGWKLLSIKEPDDRKAAPETWKSKPRNQLMFSPESVEDSHETVQQKAEALSKAPPKRVIYDNTRLPQPAPEPDPAIPSSPSMTAVADAIAGRPRLTASEAGYSGGETHRVNGWSFVDDTPSSSPSELGAPPLTWGTVDSSPLLLGSGDATPNPFQIREKSKREDLHHRIVDRVAKKKRSSARKGMTGKFESSPIPKFPNSPRTGLGSFTPAAQRLWNKIGSPGGAALAKTPNGSKGRESGLRHRWTPTPKAIRAQTEA